MGVLENGIPYLTSSSSWTALLPGGGLAPIEIAKIRRASSASLISATKAKDLRFAMLIPHPFPADRCSCGGLAVSDFEKNARVADVWFSWLWQFTPAS
jgi:hypothetical protein